MLTSQVRTAPESARSGQETAAPVLPSGSAALLRLQASTLSHTDFEAAAIAFCGEMAELTDALRVSIGMVERRHSQLLAVSKGGPETLDQTLTKQILAAMDEAYDQTTSVIAPSGPNDRRINRAAETLRRNHHGQVLTVPIAVHQRCIGAVCIEIADPDRSMEAVLALAEDAASMFGPPLFVLRQNERSSLRRIRDGYRNLSRSWPRMLRSPWRWLALAALLVLLALAIVPTQYTVSAPARVEGAVQRVVAAPANGFLKSIAVRPGDSVKQGQVLADLLDRDLQLDRSRLQGELAQHENAFAAAMARSDRSNMMIHQSKAAEARAQAELIDQQLKRIQMQSPIDGVVIQGDLAQMLGSPVEKGQVLMTVAPRNAFRVIVELDERDIEALRIGQSGRLVLSALPWDTVPVVIERITPMAVVTDGRNVFEIEAKPVNAPQMLRPGLRGVARIEVGRAPLLQVWTRRMAEHLRRFIWRWSP